MSRKGTSLIDLLISMAIVAVLFGGIYLVYFSIVASIANIGVRAAAAEAIQGEIETVRNLPYDSVGTVGGLPPGVIPQTQAVTEGNYTFSLQTTVRNIDDPFDGTASGHPAPVDTAPADYKLVEVRAICPLCSNFVSVTITTTVAPKSLESATQNGSLFLYVLNANGIGVSGATLHVVNASITPTVDLTDTTNASGVLQLVGVPTSTQGYQVFVSKSGYSSDQTYPMGAPGNPNPVTPNATVAAQSVTSVTFGIDWTSSLTVFASDDRCTPIGNETFSMSGSKLIGTSPNVLKFSTTTRTNASGTILLPAVEWDTYTLTVADAARNLAGTIPLSPMTINPSSTMNFRFVLLPVVNPSLLATVTDAVTGAGVPGAVITASKTGFSKTLTGGHSFVTQADWSGGQFSSKSGGIDAGTVGKITLLANASGTYATSTNDWLISNTFDLGGSIAAFYAITWNPTSTPAGTSILFQMAANNDNATWNFVGPDGTGGSYFGTSGTVPPLSLNGKRYFRYKVFLNTTSPNAAPTLNSVSFEFSADCVPSAQALFTGLPQGTYTVTASSTNYFQGSTTVSVGAGWQSTIIHLTHT